MLQNFLYMITNIYSIKPQMLLYVTKTIYGRKRQRTLPKIWYKGHFIYGHPFIHIDRVFSSLFLKKPIVIHSSTDTDRTENNTIQF